MDNRLLISSEHFKALFIDYTKEQLLDEILKMQLEHQIELDALKAELAPLLEAIEECGLCEFRWRDRKCNVEHDKHCVYCKLSDVYQAHRARHQSNTETLTNKGETK